MAQVYDKTFTKIDGTQRKMKFVRLGELSATEYTTYGIPTTGTATRVLAEGQETVWDVEKSAFRVFNWRTVKD